MQKTLRRLRLVATIAAVATATGCMGSFALTKMVYGWNESVTGNKIINNVIFWGPLSWAVIYGLTFATFLTLIMVPVMLLIIAKIKHRRQWKRAGRSLLGPTS